MSTGGWALGRRPALDGIRGLAIALVVISHALSFQLGSSTFRCLGSAGVAMFFALSGYLITSLFCEDSNLARFYRNRAVRLLPALTLTVVGFCVMQAYLSFPLVHGVVWVLLYVGNWHLIAGGDLGALSTTWSLAVEEQFYLLWPLLLLATRRWPRAQMGLTTTFLISSILERFVLFPVASEERLYLGSDTAAGSLLVGCLLALAVRRGLPPLRAPQWALLGGTAALVALACVPASLNYTAILPTLASAWATVLIWARAPFTWAWLRYLGRRSYALYLWHAGLIWMAVQIGGGSWVITALAVALAIGVAEASWRLVELPARMLRDPGGAVSPARPTASSRPSAASPVSVWPPRPSGPTAPRWLVDAPPGWPALSLLMTPSHSL